VRGSLSFIFKLFHTPFQKFSDRDDEPNGSHRHNQIPDCRSSKAPLRFYLTGKSNLWKGLMKGGACLSLAEDDESSFDGLQASLLALLLLGWMEFLEFGRA
jgi:hypothetical protein